MIAALLLAIAAPAPLASHVDVLRCGAADLRMATEGFMGKTTPVAPVGQSLSRRVGARRVPVALEPGRTVAIDGYRVRDRYVASWACVAGARRTSYVVLGYACAANPGDADDCGGEKEWFRLLDERGRFVDKGVPHGGAARDRLNTRLGIARALADGVSMTALGE